MNKLENRIVDSFLARYDNNLASIVIVGSYNTGQFVQGASDIDTIILLKRKDKLDFEEEQKIMKDKLKDLNFSIQNFSTLRFYRNKIYDEGSWSSWITFLVGSKIIYSTKEFENLRKYFSTHELSKEKVAKYLRNKDKTELDGYFKERIGWDITKALFAHIRRKLQILNFYSGNELSFDYWKCLDNVDLEEKDRMKRLGELYDHRKSMKTEGVKLYTDLAYSLTPLVLKTLKS